MEVKNLSVAGFGICGCFTHEHVGRVGWVGCGFQTHSSFPGMMVLSGLLSHAASAH